MKKWQLVTLIMTILLGIGIFNNHSVFAESGSSVTMIGDSVTLGAKPALEKQLPGIKVDAKEGRQVTDANDIVDQLKANGQLGKTVVLGLGTNGAFTKETGQSLINKIGKHRQIYWVNVYGQGVDWQDSANQTIRQLAKHNRNVHLINWHQAAEYHHDWFYDDGIHLNPTGQTAFAKLVKQNIK